MKIAERINEAGKINPLRDLAEELFLEGYDENKLMKELKEDRMDVEYAYRVEVCNYLREIHVEDKKERS